MSENASEQNVERGKINKVPFAIAGVVGAGDALAAAGIAAVLGASGVTIGIVAGCTFLGASFVALSAQAMCIAAAKADDAMGLR